MKNILKTLPITYLGELHEVQLINYTVALDEVKQFVPKQLKIREFDGKAMISMVDVKLIKMHPNFLPSQLSFNYRHFGFRLLIDDSEYNNGAHKGIFFIKSFTDNPLIVAGGTLMTDYNLSLTKLIKKDNLVTLKHEDKFVKYAIGNKIISPNPSLQELKKRIGAIDRAYSILGNDIRVTEIQRERWPIEPVECTEFENTFFKTAKFEGAFKVFETINYRWLPAQKLAK